MEILVTETGEFEYYNYSKESELESFVIKTANELFGPDAAFIELKKSLGRGKKISYPDGYVIDLSDVENPTLFIVEAELSKHDVYEHMYVQISKHLNFFDKNKKKIKNDLENAIEDDIKIKQFILDRIKKSEYLSISDLIYKVVFEIPKSLVIIIDKINDELKEVVEKNISKFSDTKVVEFKTYVRTEGKKRQFIHEFEPLLEKVGEEKEEVGTWYKLNLSNVQYLQERRVTFDKKHKISKYAQGFVYSKNKKNEIDGIVILWYKSNIDRLVKEGREYAATGKPIDVKNLELGMDVFLVELQYDRNINKRIGDPKARVHGKLDEVIRVDGDTETRIFPA